MKINIEIPEWADERRIAILAGIELVALKNPGDKWLIKTSRCSQCGKCCMRIKKLPDGTRTKCEHLEFDGSEYKCGFRGGRPYDCTVSISNLPECTERLEYGR